MSIVRTTCPTCDIVTVRAPELTVRRHGDSSEAVFVCPACDAEVVHPLNERMVPVLIGAGCPVDEVDEIDDGATAECMARHPSQGPDISEQEIQDFVAALDRYDWFDDLIADG